MRTPGVDSHLHNGSRPGSHVSAEVLMGPTLAVTVLQPNVLWFVSFRLLSFPQHSPHLATDLTTFTHLVSMSLAFLEDIWKVVKYGLFQYLKSVLLSFFFLFLLFFKIHYFPLPFLPSSLPISPSLFIFKFTASFCSLVVLTYICKYVHTYPLICKCSLLSLCTLLVCLFSGLTIWY